MKIYLASRYGRRGELAQYAADLAEAGHEVTASWVIDSQEGMTDTEIALLDWFDVMRAQAVVAFTEPPGEEVLGATRGARHVELGASLATGKRVLVVGHLENVFCHLPAVEFYPTWTDALMALTPKVPA